MAVVTDFRGFLPPAGETRDTAERAGFRFGDKGTHTSRTMMLTELGTLLASTPTDARREDYSRAVVTENILGKQTGATQKLTNQRLGELYGLDPNIPIFRVFRHLWALDEDARPLLALLTALARDPLLAGTAKAILSLEAGEEFPRFRVCDALRESVGERLNDSILDKVVRNAASSWTQAGHLEGHTFKLRRLVTPTPAALAFALYLAHRTGFRSRDLFTSGWVAALDMDARPARDMAAEAKRIGLLHLREQSGVLELGFERLDPWTGGV